MIKYKCDISIQNHAVPHTSEAISSIRTKLNNHEERLQNLEPKELPDEPADPNPDIPIG